MPFVVTEQWKISRVEYFHNLVSACWSSIGIGRLFEFIPGRARRPSMLVASVGVNLVVVMGLVGALASDETIEQLRRDGRNVMSILNLSTEVPPPPPSPKTDGAAAKGPAPQLAAAQAERVDVSETHVMPAEWSISQIAGNATFGAEQDSESAGGVGNGSGGKGADGVYDPFAGASPKRRQGNEQNGVDYLNDPGLDRMAFENFLHELRNRLKTTRGSVQLSVMVNRQGRIESAIIEGGNARQQLKLFVRTAIVGRQLYLPGNQGRKQLPAIAIG